MTIENSDKEMIEIFKYLQENSEPLGEEFSRVLNDNLWELLEE